MNTSDIICIYNVSWFCTLQNIPSAHNITLAPSSEEHLLLKLFFHIWTKSTNATNSHIPYKRNSFVVAYTSMQLPTQTM